MFRIQVFKDNEPAGEAICGDESCFLGKDSGALVELRGWRIGRRQLQFQQRAGALYVIDTGGLASMRVNGKQVSEHGPLSSTDTIELAEYRVRINLVERPKRAEGAHHAPAPVVALPQAAPRAPVNPIETPQGMELRELLHRRLIDAMDLRRVNVSRMGDAELRGTVSKLIDELLDTDPSFDPLSAHKTELRAVVLDEVVGLGPLEGLIAADDVTEIMVNRHSEIFVERGGRLKRSEISFSNDAAVVAAIERIVSPLGRRIDEASPMVDARLKDGSRVNAVIPPLAIKGPSLTIRKFAKTKLTGEDLVQHGSCSAEMLEFMRVAVERRANIVISGGTGSGKTTLLNVLSNYIPRDERIVTVEDAAELQLTQPNLVALEARPANVEGRGAVTIRDLVKNCLRMRPDRIVVGECRGGEALDMLQAMNTGHDGSMCTLHANNPREALTRLENMVAMAGVNPPSHAVRTQIASAVHMIVQISRMRDGVRRITNITEVVGMEGDVITTQPLFQYEFQGETSEGLLKGAYKPSGLRPHFMPKAEYFCLGKTLIEAVAGAAEAPL